MTRQLALLRAHGLIRKVSGTHRWLVTEHGRRLLTALLAARQADVDQLTQLAINQARKWNPRGACPTGVFYSSLLVVKIPSEEHWCQNHLADQTLFRFLEKIDQDFAEQTHHGGCWYCGAPLYRGDYERKPRGGPQWDLRYSFCCSRQGCRRRCTPASVRFLGRRVYAGFVVVLLSAMLHGVSAERVQRLRQVLQMDRRTLLRWRAWWLETFVQTRFWRAARALIMPSVCEQTLPWSLAQHYGAEQRDPFIGLLKFLAPLTVPGALDAQVM